MQKNTFGKRGEIIAENYLIQKGYKIIETNHKNKIGEIDIIAKDKDYLVFVEVKTKMSSKFGDPLEAIDIRKQNKIRQTAEAYLMKTKQFNVPCRFDAVAIIGDGVDQIRHIVNAF